VSEPVPPELLSTLHTRSWPGNVRELRNFIQRHLTFRGPPGPAAPTASSPPGPVAPLADVEALVPVHLPLKEARLAWMDQFDAAYARALLGRTKGNVTQAAAMAGVNRRFLQRLLARVGVRSEEGVASDDED